MKTWSVMFKQRTLSVLLCNDKSEKVNMKGYCFLKSLGFGLNMLPLLC